MPSTPTASSSSSSSQPSAHVEAGRQAGSIQLHHVGVRALPGVAQYHAELLADGTTWGRSSVLGLVRIDRDEPEVPIDVLLPGESFA